jgi:uncharacterized protein YggL (DUF469 family)
MPTTPHAIERPGGQVPITPPLINGWPKVMEELRLTEVQKGPIHTPLWREALKIYRTIAESPNLPEMMITSKLTQQSLAILATVLGEGEDIKKRFGFFGLSLSSLMENLDLLMSCTLSLLKEGDVARIRRAAEKFHIGEFQYVDFQAGFLHWLLGDTEKSEMIFTKLLTDSYMREEPLYTGIITHILGNDGFATLVLKKVQKERDEQRGTLWRDGIIVLEDKEKSQLIYTTIWTAIFYVMMAGVDLRELIPK